MMENCVYSILKKTNKTQNNYHSYSLISDVHTYIILKNLVGHTYRPRNIEKPIYIKNQKSDLSFICRVSSILQEKKNHQNQPSSLLIVKKSIPVTYLNEQSFCVIT